jgi:AcrR family transcriptional regulator
VFDAIAAETVASGYADLSIERIVARADIAREEFDRYFTGRLDAVEQTYAALFERVVGRLLRSCGTQSSWALKVKVGIGATLDMAAASPEVARFLLLDAEAVHPAMARQVVESRNRLARLLVAGRSETVHGASLPGVIEEALIAGVAAAMATQLRAGEAEHLPTLAPQLVELTLAPYLGREEAARVARRPRPEAEDG